MPLPPLPTGAHLLSPTPEPTPAPPKRHTSSLPPLPHGAALVGRRGATAVDTPAPAASAAPAPPNAHQGNPFLQAVGHAFQHPLETVERGLSVPLSPIGIAARGIKAGAPAINAILNAQRDAVYEAAFHQHNSDANRAALRHKIGLDNPSSAVNRIGARGSTGMSYGQAPHAIQGATDTLLDTAIDPLTYETLGAAPVLKALGLSGKVAPALFRQMTATPLGRELYKFLNWGGDVAIKHGPETVDTIRGAANRASATGSRVQQHLVSRFQHITKGLSPQDRLNLGRALNNEPLFQPLTPKLQSAERQLRTLTELDFKLRTDAVRTIALLKNTQDLSEADRTLLTRAFARGEPPPIPVPAKRVKVKTGPVQPPQVLDRRGEEIFLQTKPKQPFTLMPANQAAIEHATMLNERYHKIASYVEDAMPRREHYMPWAHTANDAGGTEARTFNRTEHFDPRAQHREDVHVTKPEQLTQGFEAMAANTGRQVERRLIHEQLGNLLDDEQVSKLFEQQMKATGVKRSDRQRLRDAWLAVIGYPRAATVSLTPRHGMNILDLLVNTVPPQHQAGVLADTMALAKKLVLADPKTYARLTQPGRDLGALAGSFSERKAFFQNAPILKHWTAFNNKLVWAIDTAAKQVYAQLLETTGEASGLRAGGLAAKRLVDYEHLSPLQERLKMMAPFGTFRGGIPGAVLGGVTRNPARAAAISRLTGGTAYGGKPDPGKHGITLYNPTADVGRGITAPQEYARATLADPVKAALTLAVGEPIAGQMGASVQALGQEIHDLPRTLPHGKLPQPPKPSKYADAVKLRMARYLNYGNPIDLRWLISASAAGVLEARTALNELGYGQFQKRQGTPTQRAARELLQQTAGIGIH